MKNILGIDIGRVIIDRSNDKTSTSLFGNNFLNGTPSPYAYERILQLNEVFHKDIYLISKASIENERRVLLWLEHQKFYQKTGIDRSRISFCRELSGKKDICIGLGVTHFVDDNPRVLSHLVGIVPKLYLFNPGEEELTTSGENISFYSIVRDWNECYQKIVESI